MIKKISVDLPKFHSTTFMKCVAEGIHPTIANKYRRKVQNENNLHPKRK